MEARQHIMQSGHFPGGCSVRGVDSRRFDADAVRVHYDRMSFFYGWLWGEHIHHGYWEDGESPSDAQVNLIRQLARRARVPRKASVLDVGCGIGGSALWLARELGCSVWGITNSPVQQRMAMKRACTAGLLDRVRFEVQDAARVNFAPGSCDVVWVIECSEHLSDKQRFVQNCARVLRSGGTLALSSWLAAETSSASANPKLVQQVCDGMLCPGLATMSQYTAWLSSSGFENITAHDVTQHVEKTWEVCETILRRPMTRLLLRFMDHQTHHFAGTFSAVRRAYAEGAMAYGMFTATKP
jgi:tocopherol O-methyltransferase